MAATEKVLVSGATGFIAMHLIEKLLARGHDVVGTVRDPDAADKVAPLWAMPGAEAPAPEGSLVAAALEFIQRRCLEPGPVRGCAAG